MSMLDASRRAAGSPGDESAAPEIVLLGGGTFKVLAKHWWMLAARGVFAILFGILALSWPGPTLASLILLFAAYLLVDAALASGSAIVAASHREPWIALACEALFNAVAAAVVLAFPLLSLVVMVYTAAFWAILSGAALLVASTRFAMGGWLMAVGAIASIALGCVFIVAPVAGAIVIALWLGIYALVFGSALLAVSWQLRRYAQGRMPRA